jgi:hypothetical protein
MRALVVLVALSAPALADSRGEWIETDTLGMNVYTYNFDKGAATTVGDAQNLSDFVGLHYYFADHLRVGMNLQLTERLAPDPAAGSSRIQTFALLPQIGWHFYNPFFVGLVATIAPWTSGRDLFDAGFQAVAGASAPLAHCIRGSLAVEIPMNFVQATTIGTTILAGISIRL